jgi:hypothetical protein
VATSNVFAVHIYIFHAKELFYQYILCNSSEHGVSNISIQFANIYIENTLVVLYNNGDFTYYYD